MNIDSIFNKTNELDSILKLKFDVVFLNETKLDSLVPLKFYVNSNYNIIRADRNRNGGRLAIFIERCYKYTYMIPSPIYQSILLKIKNITL